MATDPYAALRWRDGENVWPGKPVPDKRVYVSKLDKARVLFDQGVEIEMIAERLGVSIDSVTRALRQVKIVALSR